MAQVLISEQVEKKLQNKILPDLEKGRKGFDLPHTQAVVYWMKFLIEQLADKNLDPLVLITTAYAHDWGYIGLFDGVTDRTLKEINKRKPLHMQRGAEMIEKFLREELSEFFSEAQILRVAHLVRIHDLVEAVHEEDEVLIMEADTLGMLDADRVKPTFSKEDNDVFIHDQIFNRRFLHFKHEIAEKIGQDVVKKRIHFYE
jgi:hypothetical protein